MGLFLVKNVGQVARLLGPKLGSIKPGEEKFFEGDDAEELQRVINTPEFRGIVGQPKGLQVFGENATIALVVEKLQQDPTFFEKLPIGAAVKVLEVLKALENAELLAAVQPFAQKPQLMSFF
jgi:hypothetical protein